MDSAFHFDAVIVGGGLAGTSVAAELALVAPPGYRALLVEPGNPGPGTAYAPVSDRLLMNGTAMAMSASSSDRQHLVRWLRTEPESALIERNRFGTYLADRFAQTLQQRPDFSVVRRHAVDIVPGPSHWIVVDDRGTRHTARDVVLALGNFAPDDSFLPKELTGHDDFVADPWRFDPHGLDGDVLLIGSGLTAMDAIALIDERGFRRVVHVVSRHGLLPSVENPLARALDPKALNIATGTPYALLRSLRTEVRRHAARGGDWRDVVEAIRGISPAIWMGWSLRDRQRFLRHLQSFWAIHRYRVPPATAAVYARLAGEGRIVRHRGRIVAARALVDDRLRVEIAGASGTTSIAVAAAINCTGPNGDYTRVRRPLVENLLRRGVIRPDRLHLGLDATPDLHVIDRHGQPNEHLFALGPPLRGLFYETTAVPETRDQAARIAHTLTNATAGKRLEAAS